MERLTQPDPAHIRGAIIAASQILQSLTTFRMSNIPAEIHALINHCMVADRHRLYQKLQRLIRTPDNAELQALTTQIEKSRQQCEQRKANLPLPDYTDELPVSERRTEISAAIKQHQVVIIAGETGSGKTTQLPKICLEIGRGVTGMIGHTQPRRIAARTVAMRIAEELKSEVGHAVGYKVRFSDRIRPESYIKLMTDGILLAESQKDRFLNQYDTLIIDEAHERSLNIDFLLGYLKQLLPKRPDLKLIITSATIDTARFSEHFNDAPVIEVSGRTYPVEMRYRPLQNDGDDEPDRDILQGISDAVDELAQDGLGDILIFLPGEREIRETAESLRKHHPPHTEILPLYARLSASDQNRIFQSHKGRRIVLATNVAETSLTVPGIRYVIDPGMARISRYSHRTKVQRLPIEKISQASANQRAGRCGRVAPGICIRLYSEEDFSLRHEFSEPEIRRSNLAAVILQMKALRLGDIEHFPFVETPEPKMVSDGYKLLEELGAIDSGKQLTKIGQQLARLPIDPKIGRMVLAANNNGSLAELLVIASALSVQEPRERPHEKQQAADEKHKIFSDERSDFLAYLNLWRGYHREASRLTNNKLRRWCRDHFISYLRMREWHDVHVQLKSLAGELGWKLNHSPLVSDKRDEAIEIEPDRYAAIHQALLTGLLGNVALKGDKQAFTGARGIKLNIFPGSVLFKKPPKWMMAAELVETTRMYARGCARIEPEWIEHVAGERCKRTVFEPHWEKRPAAVMAFERLSLYGLIINPRRKIHYGKINPVEARELFIRGALVEKAFNTPAPFFKHNIELIDEIESLEAKSRRRDLLVDDEVLYRFYDQRLPPEIYDGRRFEAWRKQTEKKSPKLLFLKREDLMQHEADAITAAQFPDTINVAGMALKLNYHFDPTHPQDGVTVSVPLAALNLLSSPRFEWLVPGLLHEKIRQLLKSLPKGLRKNFVPMPNYTDACLRALSASDEPLLPALQQQLLRMTGVKVTLEDWQLEKLPPHMFVNFNVIDDHGKSIAMGRALRPLQQQLQEMAKQSFAEVPSWKGERQGITTWDFGELATDVEFKRNGIQMRGYPALIDQQESVAIELRDNAQQAEQETRIALRRMVEFRLPDKLKYLSRQLPHQKEINLYYAPVGRCDELQQDLINTIIDQAFFSGELPRTTLAFDQCINNGKQNLLLISEELCQLLLETLQQHHQLKKKLKGSLSPAWLHAAGDIKNQLDHLIYSGFINQTPAEWLREYPRYFKAINLRLEKLAGTVSRDRALIQEIKPLWDDYVARVEKQQQQNILDPELTTYRWMIEELRVSLFAQELKTKLPVSTKRLKKQWAKVL